MLSFLVQIKTLTLNQHLICFGTILRTFPHKSYTNTLATILKNITDEKKIKITIITNNFIAVLNN